MSRRPAHQAWEKRKGGGRERPPSRPSSLARCGHPEGKQTLRAFCLPGWTPAEAPHPGGSTLPASHTRASGLCSSLTGHAACDSTRLLLRFYSAAPPGSSADPPEDPGESPGRLRETRRPAAPLGLQVTVCFETDAVARAWIRGVRELALLGLQQPGSQPGRCPSAPPTAAATPPVAPRGGRRARRGGFRLCGTHVVSITCLNAQTTLGFRALQT